MTERPKQSFNHVALSVPPDALGEEGRREILAFYGEVFGWTEMPATTVDRKTLVLRAHSNEQFVFLDASDEPMRCGGLEHFGLSVPQPADLDDLLERARKFQERDDRVEISERRMDDYGAVKLHGFYVRYQLPLTIEVQCFEWASGFDAQRMR